VQDRLEAKQQLYLTPKHQTLILVQDRLEAKQQLYRIRDDNRRLKEKLTALEFQLASHTSDSC
jgi:hypothetical protein